MIDSLSSIEVDIVLEQLAQQLLMDGLIGEINKSPVATPEPLGKYLSFSVKSALYSFFYIEQISDSIARFNHLMPTNPTRELQKQLPSEISTSFPLSSFKNQLRDFLTEDLDVQIWEKLWQEIAISTDKITTCYPIEVVSPETWLYEYGYWIDAFFYQLDITAACDFGQMFQNFVRDCGWIFPFEKVCIVCDRPIRVSFDEQGALHAEGKPAIEFADGYGVYVSHGEVLPQQEQIPTSRVSAYSELELPQQDRIPPDRWQASWLLTETNVGIQQALIQSLGSGGIYQELHAAVLDTWQEYDLLMIKSNIDREAIHLLKKTCPTTSQIQALRVPANIQSARQAIQWVNWDKDPHDLFT